ncbi:ATP-binding protein [Halobacteriovorax sp. RT-2-4]|uniref:sensor histidine kinase n=1 Tax=unclassified Halobacteriovorax TaxID=2639665 RepID=UPI00399A910F
MTIFPSFAMDKYEVLILHSYSRDSIWTDLIDQSIKKNLHSESDHLDVYTEYMDSKRFFGRDYGEKLYNLFSIKYSDRNIKLIITSDDNAFAFAMKYRDKLFQNSPIIFTGVNGYNEEFKQKYLLEKNYTGLVESFKIDKMLELSQSLHPKAKKFYVINTIHTPSGKYLKKEFQKSISKLGLADKVEYLEDISADSLYKKVENLEKGSFALYGGFSRDRDGNFLDFEKNLRELARRSNVPIYGFLKYYLPYGLTGGYFTSGELYGKKAALIANQIIAGEDINSIAIVEDVEAPAIFDYAKIVKFGLDFHKLPVNSQIINRNNKLLRFYEEYTFEFWFILFSFACLFISLVVLAYHFEQQKKHKKEVLRINEQLEDRVEKRTRQLIEQQSKLINSAKLASIGEMASGIAHEINNPLTIIDLSAYRIIQLSDNEVVLKSAEKIKLTVDRISKIIKGLKQLAKEDASLTSELVNIKVAIEDVISICQARFKENEIHFKIDVDENLKVHGAPVQISQVVLNLLNNSFDELVQGDSERWIKLEGKKEKDIVEISVTDSGKGISEEIFERIMEPFFTTKVDQRGTGLGLSICKNIIEHHKGRIFVDRSSPNTRFVIQLPTA